MSGFLPVSNENRADYPEKMSRREGSSSGYDLREEVQCAQQKELALLAPDWDYLVKL